MFLLTHSTLSGLSSPNSYSDAKMLHTRISSSHRTQCVRPVHLLVYVQCDLASASHTHTQTHISRTTDRQTDIRCKSIIVSLFGFVSICQSSMYHRVCLYCVLFFFVAQPSPNITTSWKLEQPNGTVTIHMQQRQRSINPSHETCTKIRELYYSSKSYTYLKPFTIRMYDVRILYA